MPAFRRKVPRVTFYVAPLANRDEWRVIAHYPGAPIRHVSGFVSKAEAEAWASGPEGNAWGRANYQSQEPADYLPHPEPSGGLWRRGGFERVR